MKKNLVHIIVLSLMIISCSRNDSLKNNQQDGSIQPTSADTNGNNQEQKSIGYLDNDNGSTSEENRNDEMNYFCQEIYDILARNEFTVETFKTKEVLLDRQRYLIEYLYEKDQEKLLSYSEKLADFIRINELNHFDYANPLEICLSSNNYDLFSKIIKIYPEYLYGSTFSLDGHNNAIFTRIALLKNNHSWFAIIDKLDWFDPNKLPVIWHEYSDVPWTSNYLSVYTRRMSYYWNEVQNYDYGLQILLSHGIEKISKKEIHDDTTILENIEVRKNPDINSEIVGRIKNVGTVVKVVGQTYQYFNGSPLFEIEHNGIVGWIPGSAISIWNNRQ